MDMTRTAAEMLEPIPANALFGIRVRRSGPEGAEVALAVAEQGVLTAHCALAYEAQQEVMPFWERAVDHAQLSTPVVVHDGQGTLVCDGAFTWSMRRRES